MVDYYLAEKTNTPDTFVDKKFWGIFTKGNTNGDGIALGTQGTIMTHHTKHTTRYWAYHTIPLAS